MSAVDHEIETLVLDTVATGAVKINGGPAHKAVNDYDHSLRPNTFLA